MKRYQLTMTALITTYANSEEEAVERAQRLMNQRVATGTSELHISQDDIANAQIEEER